MKRHCYRSLCWLFKDLYTVLMLKKNRSLYMISNEMGFEKDISSFSNSIQWGRLDISYAKPQKPGEVPPPGKNPEIIPPAPSPVTWPKKEPEIQPEREPLTNPPAAPPEIPKRPESESGVLHFFKWEFGHPPRLNSVGK